MSCVLACLKTRDRSLTLSLFLSDFEPDCRSGSICLNEVMIKRGRKNLNLITVRRKERKMTILKSAQGCH